MLKNFHRNSNGQRRGGFTLVEILMAVGISSLVMASLMTVIMFALRGFMAVGNYRDMNESSRYALDVMNRDIRGATAVSAWVQSTNNSTYTSVTFSNIDTSTITYAWNTNTSEFIRSYTKSGSTVSITLMTNVDAFTFTLCQNTPSTGLTFVAATNTSSAKIVFVDWKCSRTIRGAKQNTESVQTAQIVMRN